MNERRRYPRSARRVHAVQRVGNQRLPKVVARVGPGGFFIEEPASAARPGDLVVMEFSSSPGADDVSLVTGEVAYVDTEGVGVRLTRADWERLARLLT